MSAERPDMPRGAQVARGRVGRFMLVFERLIALIPDSPIAGPADAGSPPLGARNALGGLAGTTLGQGMYRFHTRSSAATADSLVAAADPDFGGRIACFGMDWLGRQFPL